MRHCKRLWIVPLVPFLLVPSFATAAEWRSGDQVFIGPEEVIEDDLYLFASDVSLLGTVRGDVFIAAGTIDIRGNIEGGASLAGGTVTLHGDVARGVRIAAGNTSISGTLGGDLVVAAGTARINPDARVGGDLVLNAGEANVAGQIEGSLLGSAAQADLNAEIRENVSLRVDRLRVGPEARVLGAFQYQSENEARVAEGAQLSYAPERLPVEDRGPWSGLPAGVFGFVWLFMGTFLVGLLWLWLLPESLERTVATLARAPGRSFGVGLLALLLVPLVLLFLLVPSLIFGFLSVPVVITALFAVGLASAGTFVGLFLGRFITRRLGTSQPRWVELLLGVFLLALLGVIPWLGALVGLVVLSFGLGALLIASYHAVKRQKRAVAAPA